MTYCSAERLVHNADMMEWIDRLGAYWFALWHLRRPALAQASADERAAWCRDHCGTFAARWFALGAALWLIFSTPFISSAPIAFFGLFGLVMGMWHIAWQIIAQKQAGPPVIDPPVDFPDQDHRDD